MRQADEKDRKIEIPIREKKLKLKQQPEIGVEDKFHGFWRLSKLAVSAQKDPGKDFLGVSEALLEEIAKVLEFPVASMLPPEAFSVVRKSFDARKIQKEPKFVYTVEMDANKLLSLEPRTWDFISRLEPKVGLIEHMPHERVSGSYKFPTTSKPKVAVVGSGPSGLFASLVLAEFGADVTLFERGQAVEQRGRDIGALVVRRILQLESNFCFGEGGAGTWSDGKLVTRIGRNSDSVLADRFLLASFQFYCLYGLVPIQVMKTLVHFGAPENILVDGKPHLGTDRLIPLLQNFRRHLEGLGVTIRFGTRVDDLLVEDKCVVGVEVSDSEDNLKVNTQKLGYDAVVLAVGHSARDIYQMLLSHNANLVPKDFSVGLRIEHPQELINNIQVGRLLHPFGGISY
ncbi:unnamed protein product [Ilex paraguariensis]|uniref:Pyridine nucleotide-disulphide oxidoreductase N-terminal domain-containing protein n=1 Tax=Ilex paraguariensis TaxID=185542 RepID=A0ABC8TL24_9AQUA